MEWCGRAPALRASDAWMGRPTEEQRDVQQVRGVEEHSNGMPRIGWPATFSRRLAASASPPRSNSAAARRAGLLCTAGGGGLPLDSSPGIHVDARPPGLAGKIVRSTERSG